MNKMKFEKLSHNNVTNRYQLTKKKAFNQSNKPQHLIQPTHQELMQILEFGWNMTYGAKGEHRSTRTGGKISRRNLHKFADVIIGKLGEQAFYNLFEKRPNVKELSPIDFECYGLTQWDDTDFVLCDMNQNSYQIAVKSTKHIGNLLLLEEKDWIVQNNKAIYIPNQNSENKGIFDYIFFARIKSEISELIKKDCYENYNDTELKKFFFENISNMQISTEVTGYISNQDLVHIIENHYILPQGSLFGSLQQGMDASNYYVQSGCLRPITHQS